MRSVAVTCLLAGCWSSGERVPPPKPAPAAAPSACLPDAERHFRMARVGSDIVLCGESESWDLGWGAPGDDEPLQHECFTVRPDATLAERPFAPLPGISFAFDGPCAGKICWPSKRRARLAFHPDGKRAAFIDQYDVKIFDVATGRETSAFHADIPGNFWFVGETVYIASAPAAGASRLRGFTLDGTETSPTGDLWHGAISLTDPRHLMFQSGGLSSILLLDGSGGPRLLRERKVPKGPCEPIDYGEYTEQEGGDACHAHLARHYRPYDRSLVVADGARLVGFAPAQRELFVLDADTLAERSRVKIRTCFPQAPGP